MLGKRRSLRIKSSTVVKWSTLDASVSSDAEVINYSMTGMAMVIYHDVNLTAGVELFIEPVDKLATPLKNTKGKVAWFKKMSEGGIVKCLCGIAFIK